MTQRPSAYALIFANMMPVSGVALFDWNVVTILVLYWAESVVIGILNVLRLICCQTDNILQGIPLPGGQSLPAEISMAMGNSIPKAYGRGIVYARPVGTFVFDCRRRDLFQSPAVFFHKLYWHR